MRLVSFLYLYVSVLNKNFDLSFDLIQELFHFFDFYEC